MYIYIYIYTHTHIYDISSLRVKIHRYIIKFHLCVISGYRRSVDEICAIFGFYAAWNGSFLPTFRDNISVPTSSVKHSDWPLKI